MEPIDPQEVAPRSDSVDDVIGAVLGAAVIFLLLQVLVFVVVAVSLLLLPGLGVLTPEAGGWLAVAVVALFEAVLLAYLVRMVRSNVPSLRGGVAATEGVAPAAESLDFERDLERVMLFSAVVGIAASLLLGLGAFGAKIALTVIEAFAALFLFLAIATRWLLTRRVSVWALAALGLTLGSLWWAFQQH